MTGIKQSISTCLLAGLMVVGCAPTPNPNFVGTWEGHRQLKQGQETQNSLLYTAGTVRLTVRKDGTFDLVDAGIPLTGTVRYAGDLCFLDVATRLGKPMNKQPEDIQKNTVPLRLSVLPDHSIRYFDPKGFDSAGLIMVRKTTTG